MSRAPRRCSISRWRTSASTSSWAGPGRHPADLPPFTSSAPPPAPACCPAAARPVRLHRAHGLLRARRPAGDPAPVGRAPRRTAGDDAATEIARRSRGTPRVANRLLRRVRDYAQVRAGRPRRPRRRPDALALYEVDPIGLDRLDRAVPSTPCCAASAAGPVGPRLAVAGGRGGRDGRDGLRAVPGAGGLPGARTPRGRVATPAWAHLGCRAPCGVTAGPAAVRRGRRARRQRLDSAATAGDPGPDRRTAWTPTAPPAHRWLIARSTCARAPGPEPPEPGQATGLQGRPERPGDDDRGAVRHRHGGRGRPDGPRDRPGVTVRYVAAAVARIIEPRARCEPETPSEGSPDARERRDA